MTEGNLASVRHHYWDCLVVMLRTMGRFCIRHSLRIQDVIDACKATMIAVAQEEMEKKGAPVSISRLAIMTGMHRRDVAMYYRNEKTARGTGSIPARVIGQWSQDRKYLNSAGKPRVLSFESGKGEFAELVRSVTNDLDPYTILFELERTETVARTPNGVKLVKHIFTPTEDLVEGYKYLANDVSDLMSAVDENLNESPELPHYHIKTEFDNITPDALPEIRRWLLVQGTEFQKKVQAYLAQYDRDVNPELAKEPKGVRVALGGFSYVDMR